MIKASRQVHPANQPVQEIADPPRNLRYEVIEDISKRFSLNKADIKQLFGISESTQFRYEKQNPVLKPAIADRLERFNRIYQQALELFEDEAETQRWLSTPKLVLGGETPLKVLGTDARAKKVEEILYRAEYGMFG